jgi:hypothetical protein
MKSHRSYRPDMNSATKIAAKILVELNHSNKNNDTKKKA